MPRPPTAADFVRRPTAAEWRAELEAGWPGPDGSSMSTDTIMGVRIGTTSRSFRHVDLPANRHDYYYRLARRHRLPEEWRRWADFVYASLCVEACRTELRGWRRPLFPAAWARSWVRFAVLRAAARFAWTQRAKLRGEAWKGEG